MHNDVVKLIAEIEKRPKMFIGHASIFCLKAFIDGWHWRNPADVENEEILNAFSNWLEKKYHNERWNVSWDKILFFFYNDEELALNIFFLDFHQFLREYNDPR